MALSAGLATLVIACSDDDGTTGNNTTTQGDGGGTDAPSSVDPTGPNCTDAGAPPATGDCTNTKCTAQLGEPALCVENACVKLKTRDCDTVYGDLTDDAIVFATAFPLFGSNASSGKLRRQAVELAVKEINAAKGVPTSDVCQKPRPLAFLSCTDVAGTTEDGGAPTGPELTERLKAVGTHLAVELKLPFVIGAGTSGNTTTLASTVLPAKSMQIAPSATAVSITTLQGATQDGTRLMWRTAPSDVIQGAAMAKLYAQMETAAKAANGNQPVKVAIVSKSDAYGSGIDGVLRAGLQINGKTLDAAITAGEAIAECYNDTAGSSTATCAVDKTKAAALGAITAANPDIIILTGTAEGVTDIMLPYETAAAKKPLWLLPDGMRRTQLTTNPTDDLRGRVRGTIPGVVTPLAQDFYNFRYKTAFPDQPQLIFGMAGAYDATYMFAYAAAALGNTPRTGINVAQTFAKLVGGTEKVDVGPAKLVAGFNAMTSGKSIDFNGASGLLDFDPATGEAPSDINIWCIGKDPQNGTGFFNDATGQTYNATTQALTGTYKCD